MRTIEVAASIPYEVELGRDILPLLGERIKDICPKAESVVLVSDDTVFPLCGKAALSALRGAGLTAEAYTVPHGEASKNATQLTQLLNFLAERRITRSDALVALGGGMVGDLTGFAAAVYMRGVAYFQVPTTLLAAVDSSVGGKTAVDLPAGKNLMGAFWQPRRVMCDIALLDTLPESIFTDGCAEVIKTAVLFDPELFALLEADGKAFDRETVIARCVTHKRDIVARDEFESGCRSLLNLGHTLGHAVEACSDYRLSHGRSVAIGLAAVCRAAARVGICNEALPRRVCALLEKFGLPIKTGTPIEDLMPVMLSDKKRSGSRVSVVVPETLGKCSLRPMDAGELQKFMESGLSV